MDYALVVRNIVDLFRRPDVHSERKTQALFGERLRTRSTSGAYSEVEQRDGYHGWTRTAGLYELNDEDGEKLASAYSLRVVSPIATIMDESGAPTRPYFLSYGSIVYPAREEENGDTIQIACPDSQPRVVYKDDLCQVPKPETKNSDELAESIICAAVQFLGAPYLWGGRSSLGMDCSALVQLVFGMQGIALPRDSARQRECGKEVARENIKPGDLAFSEGHVVIYMGDEEFIHCSLGEGGVEINSYSPSAHNYRKDLDEGFEIARRHC